jgi:hypothetical protein
LTTFFFGLGGGRGGTLPLLLNFDVGVPLMSALLYKGSRSDCPIGVDVVIWIASYVGDALTGVAGRGRSFIVYFIGGFDLFTPAFVRFRLELPAAVVRNPERGDK